MTNNYFAVERNGKCIDHICFKDDAENVLYSEVMEMSCREAMDYNKIDEFVVLVMDAINNYFIEEDEQTIITLVGDDDVFIWSIIINSNGEDLVYNFVDWKKDGKMYKYADEN